VNKKLFADLVESMTQMNEIARGQRAPSREFNVDAAQLGAGPARADGPVEGVAGGDSQGSGPPPQSACGVS
jgi:hypothetical protein